MFKRKILAAVTAVVVAWSTVGCQADTGQKESTPSNTAESTSQDIELPADDIIMPTGMTSDDLKNLIQINEKTLTLPTTLNELMEFDNKFTYKVVDYIDENSWSYNGKKGFCVDVMYNNKYIFATVIYSEKNDEKAMLDFPMCAVIFNKDLCQKAGIEVATTCGLDYNSSYNDIEKVFGVPNAESGYSDMVKYIFSDSEYSYVLLFEINNESKQIEEFNVGIYSLDHSNPAK